MRLRTRTFLSLLFAFAVIGLFWLRNPPDTEVSPTRADRSVSLVDKRQFAPSLGQAEIETQVLTDFQTWLASYRAGERGEAFMLQGLALAGQRRSAMMQLIQKNPTTALGASIGYADYDSLPEAIQVLVEKPFTSTGDIKVTAICDLDPLTPDTKVDVYFENGQRFKTASGQVLRSGLSKLDIPLQGIQLDGWTAVRSTIFQKLEEADRDWAWNNLPYGNPDPAVDFMTGEPLGPNPITAVAGGFVFLFSDEASLENLESALRPLDDLPGKGTGTSVIFSEIVQVQAKGFPIERVLDSQKQLSVDDTTGPKTALFIRAVFSDKPDAPISKNDLETQINTSVSEHFSDFSYGKTSMTATVSDLVYEVSKVSTEYAYAGDGDTIDEKDLWDEAVALWRADGGRPDPYGTYDIVGVVFPKIPGVGWAGLGTVGGAESQHWLNGVASTETIVHEFGHNYGLKHSNYWDFKKNGASSNPVEDEPIGESDEYGDLWDVMGDGDATRGHFHMAAKRYLSWLDENQIVTIDEVGESGTYRVYRFDHRDATGLQGLEIKKDSDENYWVGFRRAYESTPNYYRGAYILWERSASATKALNKGDPSRNQGWIIDTTPESGSERQDAGISLGRTYSDTDAGVHITPIGVGGSAPNEYLDVVVNYGSFGSNVAPTVTINVPATGDARMPVALSATGNDGDGDTLAYSWDLGNGEVYASAEDITAVYTVGGIYDVSVTVSDMKGGTETKTAQITISDPLNIWTTQTSGTANDLFALASDGTHLVAAGKSVFLRSTDGVTWSNETPSGMTNVTINGLCWTGSEFIAGGRDAEFQNNAFFGWKPVVYTSSDGSSWTKEFEAPANEGGSLYAFNQIASNGDGSKVIAAGDKGLIYRRINGGDWTEVDLKLSSGNSLGIAFGGGVFVLGGYDFDNSGLILFRTSDGAIWENLKDNSDLKEWWGLDKIAFFDGLFVGSGFFSRTVFSENGGLSWQSLEQGDTHEMNAFAFGNGVYYAIGEEYIGDQSNNRELINLVSSNGKIWTKVDSGAVESGNEIIFFKNTFIIVGDGGSIRQSGGVDSAVEILAAPVIAPEAQGFNESVTVTIMTDAENAQIRYTLDGSAPNSESTLYAGGILVTATTTIKARVFKEDLDPSPTSSVKYTKVLTGFAAWVAAYYSGENAGPSANPDGDWAVNLLEWAVGDVPDSGDSAPAAPELSFDGSGKAIFRIHRLTKSDDVTLSIEKSINMVDWLPLAATPTQDTATLLELTSDAVIDTYPCFLRIRALE